MNAAILSPSPPEAPLNLALPDSGGDGQGFPGGASGKESTCQFRRHKETQVQPLGLPLEEEMATTPLFLPGEPLGQWNLAGYSPRGCKELDTT